MGLLDNLMGTGIDDPRFAATTQLAQGLLSSPRLMQGLAQGVGGYQQAIAQARQQKAMEEERQMRMQMQQMQMQQAQAQAAKQKQLEALAGQFARSPQQMALGAEGKGPTNTALAASQTMSPGFDFAGYSQALAGIDPMAALTMQGALRKEVAAPVKLGAGESLFDATGKLIVNNPKAQDMPSAVREYQFAQQQGYQGSFQQFQLEQKRAGASSTSVSYGAPMAGVDAQGRPVFFQPSKDGRAPSIVSGVTPPKAERTLTEGQAKAAAFASQMRSAEAELSGSGFNPSSLASQVEVATAGGLGNLVAGEKAQQARQAQEQWAEAFLRFKTGAASTPAEKLDNIRTYFPQPGDKAGNIEQKARMRQQAMRDVGLNSGDPQALIRNAGGGSGGLSPAEQQELQQLRARLGKKAP